MPKITTVSVTVQGIIHKYDIMYNQKQLFYVKSSDLKAIFSHYDKFDLCCNTQQDIQIAIAKMAEEMNQKYTDEDLIKLNIGIGYEILHSIGIVRVDEKNKFRSSGFHDEGFNISFDYSLFVKRTFESDRVQVLEGKKVLDNNRLWNGKIEPGRERYNQDLDNAIPLTDEVKFMIDSLEKGLTDIGNIMYNFFSGPTSKLIDNIQNRSLQLGSGRE